MFVTLLTVVILLSIPMNHDLVTAVIRDGGEVFIALVATVEDPSVFVDGQLFLEGGELSQKDDR